MALRVGLDASAAAVPEPTGVAAAIRSLALALRQVEREEDMSVQVLYRLSRWKKRRYFLPGSKLFHDRVSFLLAGKPDVFHGPDARLPRVRGTALVATIHDLSVRKDARFAEESFRETRARHWEDTTARADVIVVYTEAIKREFARELGFPGERIAVVPLAPAILATPSPDDIAQARAKLALTGDHVLVLGELSSRKNAEGAVRAFARARERSEAARRATLVFVGRDGHGADLARAAIENERLGDAVRVLGWLEPRTLAAVLGSARLLFFPSRSEGFGLPLVEAFAAGVPALASRDPALLEVSAGAALHEDAEDQEGLAATLARLLEDNALGQDLVIRGKERAWAFSWEQSARSLARVYRAAAARSPLPVSESRSTPCPR